MDDIDYKKWMKKIDGSKKISQISIPGTHNSEVYDNNIFCIKYQKKNISEQLNNGVRFLDLKIGVYDKKSHSKNVLGVEKCFFFFKNFRKKSLNSILNTIYDFLSLNNTETVILSIENQLKDEESRKKFAKIFYNNYIKKNKNMWYLENKIPTLNDVRGKIMLLRRFEFEPNDKLSDFGFDASKWCYNNTADFDSYYVQNFTEIFTSKGVDEKINSIKATIDESKLYNAKNDNKLFLNNATIAYFLNYKCLPNVFTKKLLKIDLPSFFEKNSGIIIFNYIEIDDWKLSKLLIESNF